MRRLQRPPTAVAVTAAFDASDAASLARAAAHAIRAEAVASAGWQDSCATTD